MKNILKQIITLILLSITLFSTSFGCNKKCKYIDCTKHGKHVAVLHLTHPDILNKEKLTREDLFQRLKKTIKEMGKCDKVTAVIVNTQYNIHTSTEAISLGYHLNKVAKSKPVKIYLYDCIFNNYLLGLTTNTEIHFNKYSNMGLYTLKQTLKSQDDLLKKIKIKANHIVQGSHKVPLLEPFKNNNREKILEKIITTHQYMSELIKKYRPQAVLEGLENKVSVYADELLERKLIDHITPNIYIYADKIKEETKADKVVVYNQIKPKRKEKSLQSFWNRTFSSANNMTPEQKLLKVSAIESEFNTKVEIDPESRI